MLSALGSYGSDDEGSGGEAVARPSPPAVAALGGRAAGEDAKLRASATTARKRPEAVVPSCPVFEEVGHGAECECDDCHSLLARFSAKSLQTKGIRFKCRLCGDTQAKKESSSAHFQQRHAAELQAFKKEKKPKLFVAKRRQALPAAKISFAREDILRKRPRDADEAFGGWTKKEKPAPPPCEQPEYQDQMPPVLTAPPWANAQRPTDEDASQMDKEVDGHIAQAQVKRFCKRNTLEVRSGECRCKLCFKMVGDAAATARHVMEAHEEDFQKEMKIWERYLFTTCRRQPPFGWVCKVCSLFFPSDGAVWRHMGKEVYIRHEERHLTTWHDKEDRWGHEEDGECCGDGMNSGGGLSMESVQMFQQEHARQERQEALERAKGLAGAAPRDEDSGDDQIGPALEEVGVVKQISEF